jgi:hypothetical protein
MMEAFCFPGVTGTIVCPCSNPPVAFGSGCDNAPISGQGTGGAVLASTGTASTQNDSLSLDVTNSLPTLHSLYVGTSFNPSGIVFGAGVRCISGSVAVLATATAGGTAPASISFTGIYAKSSAAGVTPVAGQTRYYLVTYSNPAMAGANGCSVSTNFNATNSGAVLWTL